MKVLSYEFDSKKQLDKFPSQVREQCAHALYEAQKGGKHNNAKVLSGFEGANVVEIRDQHKGCAYRVCYTTRVPKRICVIHAFKKKSTRGIATPKHEIDLIRQRYKEILEKYAA